MTRPPSRSLVGNPLAPVISGLVASGLLLASLLASWIAEGPGSTYPGFRLARALEDGNSRVTARPIVFWALLGVGAAAALVAFAAPFRSLPARVTRGAAGTGVIMALAAAGAFGSYTPDKWAVGPWLALCGASVAVMSAVLPPGPATLERMN